MVLAIVIDILFSVVCKSLKYFVYNSNQILNMNSSSHIVIQA